MIFRLAIVGHRSSIDEIQQIIAAKFENVESTGVELANDSMTGNTLLNVHSEPLMANPIFILISP